MQENYKIYKIHSPTSVGKSVLNKTDFDVVVVNETDDECEVIMREKKRAEFPPGPSKTGIGVTG